MDFTEREATAAKMARVLMGEDWALLSPERRTQYLEITNECVEALAHPRGPKRRAAVQAIYEKLEKMDS